MTDTPQSYKFRFRLVFPLAPVINLLTHDAKGTFSFLPRMALIRTAYRGSGSGSISPVIYLLFNFPSRYFVHYRSMRHIYSLEDGPPLFRQVFSHPTYVWPTVHHSWIGLRD